MSVAVVSTEKRTCDFCKIGEAHSYSGCLGCGKDCCWQCKKKEGAAYSAGVNHSGSGDGFYCSQCDNRLMDSGDELHAAYRVVRELREENSRWYAEFELRRKRAEVHLEKLYAARKSA